ncbi:MAG: phospholipase D family protein [Desulfobacteraceae bacterium]|jgi:phosphatidylserine/phosphatidylglycerophosphate/cardiolipin synthase-like enzyme|nr:MAG: phospholipase D family protein [Desulfobacteraceae bacterium]
MEGILQILFGPEDRIMDYLMKEFFSAQGSIDIVVFLLGSKTIANTLVKAHQRGVAVRMIIDGKVARTRNSKHGFLVEKGIDVRTIRVTGGSMHSKFILIDSKKVIAGSTNLTNDANYRNHELMFVSEDPSIIERFSTKFEALLNGGNKQTPRSGERGR